MPQESSSAPSITVSSFVRETASPTHTVPSKKADIREMSRDEAIILMVESNLQRSVILPSEKAFSYKMRLEAMNRLPGRPSGNLTPVVSEKMRTNEELGKEVGESREQIDS